VERTSRHSVHLLSQLNREIRNSIVESIANSAITNRNIANKTNIKLISAAKRRQKIDFTDNYRDIFALR